VSKERKTVLILGAGRVSAPCVSYLVGKGYSTVVTDASVERLRTLSSRFPGISTMAHNASDGCSELLNGVAPDAAVCLLPPQFMAPLVKLCGERGIHLTHPAYLDGDQRSMSDEIKRSGAVIIGELGLDPGIDHMSAARAIKRARENGYEVESFRSVCGALPSAEANDNPWCYKLSWAPESLIGASRRDARFIEDGREIYYPDGATYEHASLQEVDGLGWYEVYANGDSTPYRGLYSIQEAGTVYRGTLRYVGWCETISVMNELGLTTSERESLEGLTYAAYVARKLGVEPSEARAEFRGRLGLRENSAVYLRMDWLGFFDDEPIGLASGSAQDVMGKLFGGKLVFKPGERDLIVLVDEFILRNPNTSKRKRITSRMVDFGERNGDSAIARTTGIPPAIAAHLILTGEISAPGLHIPVIEEIYEPTLTELETMGFKFSEKEEEI
jgi:saccharopine dehydrogenase (NADP+, L-glutamate forming)